MAFINTETPFSKHMVEWLSAWNPCIWRYERQDVVMTNTQTLDQGGGVFITQISVGIGNIDPNLKARDGVFIRIPGTFYDEGKTLKVLSITTAAGIVTLEPYAQQVVTGVTGGFANWIGARPGYRVEVQMFNTQFSSPNDILNTIAYHPSVGAEIVADIREFMQAQLALTLKNDFGWNYGQVNVPDLGREFRFELRARESYVDRASANGERITTSFVEAENVVYYGVRNGQDIQNNYNHMIEYYLDPDFKAEFLSVRKGRRVINSVEPPPKRVRHWLGLPWSVSFMYNYNNRPESPDIDFMNPATLERKLEFKDVNGQTIGSDTDPLVYSGVAEPHVNHLGLFNASTLDGIDNFDIWIEDNEGVVPPATYAINVEPQYTLGGYWDLP